MQYFASLQNEIQDFLRGMYSSCSHCLYCTQSCGNKNATKYDVDLLSTPNLSTEWSITCKNRFSRFCHQHNPLHEGNDGCVKSSPCESNLTDGVRPCTGDCSWDSFLLQSQKTLKRSLKDPVALKTALDSQTCGIVQNLSPLFRDPFRKRDSKVKLIPFDADDVTVKTKVPDGHIITSEYKQQQIQLNSATGDGPPRKRKKLMINETRNSPAQVTEMLTEKEKFQELMSMDVFKFELWLKSIVPDDHNAETIVPIITNLLQSEDRPKYDSTIILLRLYITPLVGFLQGCVSRSLVSSLYQLVENFPSESVNGFLLPLMQDPHFGSSQSDLMTKLVSTLTSDCIGLLWRRFVQESHSSKGVWSEPLVSVVQAIVDSEKLEGIGVDTDVLVAVLTKNARSLENSTKFANLISTLCSRFNELSDVSVELYEIASSHRSMFKSKLIKAVKRLMKM